MDLRLSHGVRLLQHHPHLRIIRARQRARNSNASESCDPQIDREIKRAQACSSESPSGRRLWELVDRETVDRAPWVPLVNPKVVDVLSKRVGNYQYSPAFGMLFDQLWVR